MKILRFLKSNWYISLIIALIIIIIILPKNRSNEGTINYNTNHTYPDKISVYVEGEVRVEGKMYFYSTDTVLDLLNASGVTDYSQTEMLIKRNAKMTVIEKPRKRIVNGDRKTFIKVVVE